MNDSELLQAISSMIDKKLEPIQQDIGSIKAGQESLEQEVAGLTAGQEALKQAQIMTDINMEKGQKFLQQQVTKTNIILENDISKKLGALFDGHQLDSEKIQSIKVSIEAIEEAVDANDTLTKVNAMDISKLKEKEG